MEDLRLGRIAALVPEFAVKDLPLGWTLMLMFTQDFWWNRHIHSKEVPIRLGWFSPVSQCKKKIKIQSTFIRFLNVTLIILARYFQWCWYHWLSVKFFLYLDTGGHDYWLCQGSSTFWVWGPIYIFHIILQAAVTADYHHGYINNIIGAWAACQVT